MDKISKFLGKLSKKQRQLFLMIFCDIQKLELDKYDFMPLSGKKDIYRLRKGGVRIVFHKGKKKGVVLRVAFRKEAYGKKSS